jgi:hypothetical protein
MAVSPSVGTYATRSTYVSPSEFKNSPIGVDVSQLVPGGNANAQAAALVLQLQRASALADNFCQKVLAATVDTQAGYWRIQSHRSMGPVLKVTLDHTPIIAVSAVSVGTAPNALIPLTDLSNVWISRKTATIPLAGVATGPTISRYDTNRFATVQYVNGWANTVITTSVPIGSTTITVASTLGIMPGMQLNVQSANGSEMVTISPTFVPSNTGQGVAVPIVSPTVGAYSPNDTVTAMPQDIKQAVILIAKSLIKTRGSESITIASTSSQPDHINHLEPGVSSDFDLAMDLLEPYKRAF